jgi:hypothetical protein
MPLRLLVCGRGGGCGLGGQRGAAHVVLLVQVQLWVHLPLLVLWTEAHMLQAAVDGAH